MWDSSIVAAKYLEKIQESLVGKCCLDLSAGCGLVGVPYQILKLLFHCSHKNWKSRWAAGIPQVWHTLCSATGIVLAKLGAEVVASDLGPNLGLLELNCIANGGELSLVCAAMRSAYVLMHVSTLKATALQSQALLSKSTHGGRSGILGFLTLYWAAVGPLPQVKNATNFPWAFRQISWLLILKL